MSTGGGSLGHRTAGYGQRFSPPPQYDPYGPQLGYLSESIHRVLTERECGIFDRGLADYHRRRNVKAFVECLSLVLNTNHKRQLLIPVRDTYVKPSDVKRFNELVQVHGIATSLRRKKKEEEKALKQQQQQQQEEQQQTGERGIKKVDVKRDSSGGWGFNIRGGSEHGIGIFVSWVDPGSNAHKVGLQVGDQILKANDTNLESISHYEAVQLMKGSKKLRLWILSRGRVPGSRMAHKAYRWVDPMGRVTTPPLDPMEVMEQRARGVLNEADERKVTVMVDSGRELGISIRGGAEHGLGIYISLVEEGSVAEAYGLKVGDQVLQVNGINFMNIVHADAANALRAQPCMVMMLKDIGKLPHSRITTYGQTQWYQSPPSTPNRPGPNPQESPAFARGAGTQVMFKKQESSIKGRGIMNEVARSVLSSQEHQTFNYYVSQYEHSGLPVEDLVTPLLDLLNTAEKLQLISEVRAIVRARDLNRFNELCVHREIAAKKVATKSESSSQESLDGPLPDDHTDGRAAVLTGFARQPQGTSQTTTVVYNEDPDAIFPLSLPEGESSPKPGERTLTPGDMDNSFESDGRDNIPQKLSPPRRKPTGPPIFRVPPPPSSPPSTSTPELSHSSNPKASLATTLKDRRQMVRPGAQELSGQEGEESWNSHWTDPSLSSIQSPTVDAMRRTGVEIMNAPGVRLSMVERQVRSETEDRLRKEFEMKERRIVEEQQRTLEREKHEKEQLQRVEREEMEIKLREVEERTRRELEVRIREEAEEEMRGKLEERERELVQQQARREKEEQQRRDKMERKVLEQHIRKVEERTKQELEEKIWKEAEEHIRDEFESRIQKERETLSAKKHTVDEQTIRAIEDRVQRESEEKFRQEYEQKIARERQKVKRAEEAERKKWEEAERKRREEEIARLESEEQAKIELEERIRKEAEAQARAEYEARLQQETAARARLAQEVQAHKAAGQRMELEKHEVQDMEQQKRLDQQHKIREAKEEEIQREEEEIQRAEDEERQRKDAEKRKRRELERKREENLRRREEEKQRASEQRRKGQGKRRQQQQEEEQQRQQQEQQRRQEEEEEEERRQQQERKKEEEAHQRAEEEAAEQQRQEAAAEEQKRQREDERKAAFNIQQVKVHFGEDEKEEPKVIRRPKSRRNVVDAERQRAEEKLRRRMEREKAKRAAAERERASGDGSAERGAMEEQDVGLAAPAAPRPGGKSYGGYENLYGQFVTITITKVCKRLGIAIDGGANTKQKAVIIREISPGGCAAQTGAGLSVGQQLLAVSGTCLYGLKHKDVVMTIKNAFEGPLNKTTEFLVLDPEE